MSTVRIFLTKTVVGNLPIRQMDVPTAFLNGELSSEIYIKAPKRVGNEDEVYKLRKALYGLKEFPRCWNQRIDNFLQQKKFKRSKNDFCLYTKGETNLLIFVDDILILGKSEEIIKQLKDEFNPQRIRGKQ